MPGKADKPTQNSALQGISEQENFMIRVLFICHGNNSITPKKVSIYADSQGWRNEISTILALLK